jgi:hypothetical protein
MLLKTATRITWCPWRESDPRPLPYQGSALPLSHMGPLLFLSLKLLLKQGTASNGAGDEARTHDIQFGKLKLYQLSYTRLSFNFYRLLNYTVLITVLNIGGGGWIRTSVLRENGFTVRRL